MKINIFQCIKKDSEAVTGCENGTNKVRLNLTRTDRVGVNMEYKR